MSSFRYDQIQWKLLNQLQVQQQGLGVSMGLEMIDRRAVWQLDELLYIYAVILVFITFRMYVSTERCRNLASSYDVNIIYSPIGELSGMLHAACDHFYASRTVPGWDCTYVYLQVVSVPT